MGDDDHAVTTVNQFLNDVSYCWLVMARLVQYDVDADFMLHTDESW